MYNGLKVTLTAAPLLATSGLIQYVELYM